MKKSLLVPVWAALIVLLASGASVAQTTSPEYPHYRLVDRWNAPFPKTLAVDSQGYVYVPGIFDVEVGGVVVRKFAPDGTLADQWDVLCWGINSGIAIDSRDRVYLTGDCGRDSSPSPRVQKYTSNGVLLTQWGSRGTGNGQFEYLNGVAIDSRDNVYVVDPEAGQIKKFTSEGAFLAKWDAPVVGDIAVDSSDRIYAMPASIFGGVLKFAPNGTSLGELDGLEYLRFNGLGADKRGNVFVVVDNQAPYVRRVTSEGAFVTGWWGTDGEEPDLKDGSPEDVAIGPNGHAYAADYWNGIRKFTEVPDAAAPTTTTSTFGQGINKFGRTRNDVEVSMYSSDEGVGVQSLTYATTGAQVTEATTVQGRYAKATISA